MFSISRENWSTLVELGLIEVGQRRVSHEHARSEARLLVREVDQSRVTSKPCTFLDNDLTIHFAHSFVDNDLTVEIACDYSKHARHCPWLRFAHLLTRPIHDLVASNREEPWDVMGIHQHSMKHTFHSWILILHHSFHAYNSYHSRIFGLTSTNITYYGYLCVCMDIYSWMKPSGRERERERALPPAEHTCLLAHEQDYTGVNAYSPPTFPWLWLETSA